MYIIEVVATPSYCYVTGSNLMYESDRPVLSCDVSLPTGCFEETYYAFLKVDGGRTFPRNMGTQLPTNLHCVITHKFSKA
jgi:hypothetical protein